MKHIWRIKTLLETRLLMLQLVVAGLVAIEVDEVEDVVTIRINDMTSSAVTRTSMEAMISVVVSTITAVMISVVVSTHAVEAMVAAILEATVSTMVMDHAQLAKSAARRGTLLSIAGRGFRRTTVALKNQLVQQLDHMGHME
jgi:hypothetical protein